MNETPQTNFKKTQEFDAISGELFPGGCLIEANAGSGKTFSIIKIFIRLLFEKQIPLREILAVTFTNAAVNELKERLRKELTIQIEEIRSGREFKKQNGILQHSGLPPEKIKILAEKAAGEISELSVFTIHGFCQKFLEEFCLDTGFRSDSLEPGSGKLLAETACKDVWRIYAYEKPQEIANFFLSHFPTPQKLSEIYTKHLGLPGIKIRPEKPKLSEEESAEIFSKIRREILCGFREKNWMAFLREKNLGRTIEFEKRLNKLTALLSSSQSEIHTYIDLLSKCTFEYTSKRHKTEREVATHSFCKLVDSLRTVCRNLFYAHIHTLKSAIEERIDILKTETNQIDFQDLISGVFEAIQKKPSLKKKINKLYQAALVDEFQDTDLFQYEIFIELFQKNPNYLYWIGDPKQSIYRFRNADIFIYEKAKQKISLNRRFTLSNNWRSTPAAVEAVNFLFKTAHNPFRYNFIEFTRSTPKKGTERKLFSDDKELSGIGICPVDSKSANEFRDVTATDVAMQIRKLLNGNAYFENETEKKKVAGEDIAVLVKTHTDGELIGKKLNEQGIAFVGTGDASKANVLGTEEARQILLFQKVLLNPSSDVLIRSFLIGDIFGCNADDLIRLDQDAQKFAEIRTQFFRCRKIWQERGFLAALNEFSTQFGFSAVNCRTAEELTVVINCFHLAELITEKIEFCRITPQESHQRYQKMLNKYPVDDEFKIKTLLSENLVNISTVHAAKGLEFPIVFCPFLNSEGEKPGRTYSHYQDTETDRRTLEILPQNTEKEKEEISAELMRLIYVAITRSKYYTAIYRQIPEQEKKTPPFYELFPQGPIQAMETSPESIWKISGETIRTFQPEPSFAKKSKFQTLQSLSFSKEHTQPKFDRIFLRQKSLHSFTSLSKKTESENFDNGEDNEIFHEKSPGAEVEFSFEDSQAEDSILTFPKGPIPGIFWHDLLENTLSPEYENSLFPQFDNLLRVHGIEKKWKPVIEQTRRRIDEIRLKECKNSPVFKDLSREKMIPELKFNLSIDEAMKKTLTEIFATPEYQKLPKRYRENFEKIQTGVSSGFLKGFIDVLFEWEDKYYILDWKTNYLGNRPENYSPKNLNAEIEKHNYTLQYLIYSLAVNTWLLRTKQGYLPEKNFGGVYYLFLRGLQTEESNETRTLYFDSLTPCKNLLTSLARSILSSSR